MLKDALISFQKEFVRRVKSDPDMATARASGNFERVIETEYEIMADRVSGKLIQYGPVYSPFIDAGRPPGRVLRQGIYEWLKYKKYGISWSSKKERVSLSWAISKSIEKKGSWKFKNNKQTRIVERALEGARTDLAKSLADFYNFEVEARVQEDIENINKISR